MQPADFNVVKVTDFRRGLAPTNTAPERSTLYDTEKEVELSQIKNVQAGLVKRG